MARPAKLTPELTRKITTYIQDGNSPTKSATLVGIAPSTYFNWMSKGSIRSRDFWSFRSQLSARVRNQLLIVLRISRERRTVEIGVLRRGC